MVLLRHLLQGLHFAGAIRELVGLIYRHYPGRLRVGAGGCADLRLP